MPITGPVFALDLATDCGYCCGRPGERPRAGSVRLKKSGEPRAVAFGNLIWFLSDWWSGELPAIVVKERMMTTHAAARGVPTHDAAVRLHAGLHGITEGLCARYRIPFDAEQHDVGDSTWRKHFLGRGRWGGRDEAKAACVRRCRALGYLSRDCADVDAAEAIGIWDWACSVFARRASPLVLYEGAAQR